MKCNNVKEKINSVKRGEDKRQKNYDELTGLRGKPGGAMIGSLISLTLLHGC